jgi:hypothetical protein
MFSAAEGGFEKTAAVIYFGVFYPFCVKKLHFLDEKIIRLNGYRSSAS